MKNCTFIPALLYCSFCSVLVSGSQTVKVQPGDDVTLECRKNSSGLSYWFRLGEKNKVNCISVLINNDPNSVKNCDGFQKEKFNMSSNSSTVSLKIIKVNLSDVGLYFCGVKKDKSIAFNVIHLHVKGNLFKDTKAFYEDTEKQKEPDVNLFLINVALYCSNCLLIIIIIFLCVKVIKHRKVNTQDGNSRQNEVSTALTNPGSHELTYASVSFEKGGKRRREVEPDVVYAATR
uniref:Ig-like domain-containing protein n=1 Tax=Poecilia formosa TaxID=48698 RepID=A0A087Y0Q6_POEFO